MRRIGANRYELDAVQHALLSPTGFESPFDSAARIGGSSNGQGFDGGGVSVADFFGFHHGLVGLVDLLQRGVGRYIEDQVPGCLRGGFLRGQQAVDTPVAADKPEEDGDYFVEGHAASSWLRAAW